MGRYASRGNGRKVRKRIRSKKTYKYVAVKHSTPAERLERLLCQT